MALGPGCRVGVPRPLGEGLGVSTLVPISPWERWGGCACWEVCSATGAPDPGPCRYPGGIVQQPCNHRQRAEPESCSTS